MSPAGRNPTRGILSGGHDCAGNARLMVERVTWQETRPSRSRPVSHTLFSFPVGKETFGRRGRGLVVLCPRLPYSLEYSEMLGEQVEKSRKEGRKKVEFRARLERRYHGLKSETRRDETRRGEEDWNKKAGRNTLGFG